MEVIEMANYAYDNVPMLMELNKKHIENMEEFQNLPFIEKNDLIENSNKTISMEYLMDSINGSLDENRTSGSTGKCLQLFSTSEEYYESMMPLWMARRKYYGIRPDDKMCYFYTVHNNTCNEYLYKNIRYEMINNAVGFSKLNLIKNNIIDIYEFMREYKPKWIILQPSVGVLFADVIKEYKLEKIDSLRYIESSSEILLDYERKLIEGSFGCRVVNQYGCNEVNSIAYECPQGNLHCFTSNTYIEIIKNGKQVNDGEEGDVYITALHNKVMPLVRYGIGDRGILYKNHNCKCGNMKPIIKLNNGRKDDFIICEDGRRISAYSLVNAVEKMNYYEINIIKFQVVQEEYREFKVKFVLNSQLYDVNEERFAEEFISNLEEDYFNSCNFEIAFLEDIQIEETGKLKFFVSKLNNRGR